MNDRVPTKLTAEPLLVLRYTGSGDTDEVDPATPPLMSTRDGVPIQQRRGIDVPMLRQGTPKPAQANVPAERGHNTDDSAIGHTRGPHRHLSSGWPIDEMVSKISVVCHAHTVSSKISLVNPDEIFARLPLSSRSNVHAEIEAALYLTTSLARDSAPDFFDTLPCESMNVCPVVLGREPNRTEIGEDRRTGRLGSRMPTQLQVDHPVATAPPAHQQQDTGKVIRIHHRP